ncbi:MAG: catechol 2,3-dioxygenase [Proteobacteria bacterium]|nr:catechol 2,3-dioxygenase [Pseudomonadota bacterium]
MGMNGVLRPGHAAIRVLDLEPAVTYYIEVMGLIETARDDRGRVYLKAWDEHDHHSLVLREADSPGLDYMGFKVVDDATLDAMAAGLAARGVAIEAVPAGEHVGTGRRVRFRVPTGHAFELYAHKDIVGNGMPTMNPGIRPDALKGIAPVRLDHALMYGADLDGTVALFTEVLGFQVTESVAAGDTVIAAFLSCGAKVHDIAFVRQPADGKLHHIAFYVDSWDDVLRAADTIAANDVSHDLGPTRHGISRGQTVYCFDPSGNRNEVFTGGYMWYPDRPPLKWTADELPRALFIHERKLRDSFMSVVT